MKYVFLDIKMCGIKCIDKEIEIQFANKTIDDSVFAQPHIKAIYGTNGAGKSSFMHGMNLYCQTIKDPEYLMVESRNGNLKEIINKKNNEAYVETYIAAERKKGFPPFIVHHRLEYKFDNNEALCVSHELVHLVKGNRWGSPDTEELLYEVKEGKIVFFNEKMKDFEDAVTTSSYNLLIRASLSSFFILLVIDEKRNSDFFKNDFANAIYHLYLSIIFTSVFIDEKDIHKISKKTLSYLLEKTKELKDKELPDKYGFSIDYEIDEVKVEDYGKYLTEIKKIERFLKIFKPELDEIDIDPSPANNVLICKKLMIYKDGTTVSSEYESNGIKKLMKLYPYLNYVETLGTVFIDEFDSNIHDVYLCKLIEYFVNFTHGQFVFTTHNLGPMEVLDDAKMKYSIDFINDSKISSWKRNGNYSVVNLYRSGAIPNCPFNIDSADFVKTFGD